MNASERAYVAGLYEGEGFVTLSRGRWVQVGIAMSDREPPERVLALVGGGIYAYDRAGCKTMYRWRLGGWQRVTDFYGEIKEWLSPRRIAQFESKLSVSKPPERPVSPPCGREVRGAAGYNWHKRRGEPPCEACRAEVARYQRERRAA